MESHRGAAPLVAMPLIWLLLALVGGDPTATDTASPPAKAGSVHVIDEKERIQLQQTDNVRLSLPTQGDRDAWASPGFRVQLGYGYALVHGLGPALSFNSHSFTLRPSVRIDPHWALGVAMLFGTGPGGLRWSATLEPTFVLWRQLALSVGLGYGGLLVDDPNASAGTLTGANVTITRNLTEGERLQSCRGAALSSAVRIEYLFVVGALFASGPFVEGSGQWTRCEATFGRTDAETGRPVVLTQWWRQTALNLGWWLAWR